MTNAEAERIKLHLSLRETIGQEASDILMEHLPPFEWDTIARRDDVFALRSDMDQLVQEVDRRFQEVDRRFDEVDRRFQEVDRRFQEVDRRFEEVDRRFDHLERRLSIVIGGGLTFALAIIALQVQSILMLANK